MADRGACDGADGRTKEPSRIVIDLMHGYRTNYGACLRNSSDASMGIVRSAGAQGDRTADGEGSAVRCNRYMGISDCLSKKFRV